MPGFEAPPGVCFSLTAPNAATEAGWFFVDTRRHGEHWLKPCAEHHPVTGPYAGKHGGDE